MPSSWQHSEANAGAFCVGDLKSARTSSGAVDEELYRLARGKDLRRLRLLSDPAATATARGTSAPPRCRALRGCSRGSARRGTDAPARRPPSRRRRAGARSYRAAAAAACRLRCSVSVCVMGLPGSSFMPSTVATVCGTRPGSESGASSTNQTPSGNCSSESAATLQAERVLPQPPEPVSVSRRACEQQRLDFGDSLLRRLTAGQLPGQVVALRVSGGQRQPCRRAFRGQRKAVAPPLNGGDRLRPSILRNATKRAPAGCSLDDQCSARRVRATHLLLTSRPARSTNATSTSKARGRHRRRLATYQQAPFGGV